VTISEKSLIVKAAMNSGYEICQVLQLSDEEEGETVCAKCRRRTLLREFQPFHTRPQYKIRTALRFGHPPLSHRFPIVGANAHEGKRKLGSSARRSPAVLVRFPVYASSSGGGSCSSDLLNPGICRQVVRCSETSPRAISPQGQCGTCRRMRLVQAVKVLHDGVN
jgi:hypothetical protein